CGRHAPSELPLARGPRAGAGAGEAPPPLPAEPEPVAPQVSTRAEEAPAPTPRLDRRQRFSMERLLRDPSAYRNLMVRARTERGGLAEGRFLGIDQDGNLNIRRVISGPGEALYNLAPAEIASLELLEP